MEDKKNTQIRLESKRGLYLSIGLVLSVAMVTLAFEWKSYDRGPIVDLGSKTHVFEHEKPIPVTVQIPPKPKVQLPKILEIPNEQDPDVELDFSLEIDISTETAISEYVPDDIPEDEESDQPFIFVEHQPSPTGGMQSFYKYLSNNLKYPKQAVRAGVEGKVYVQFVVNTDGSLTDLKVLKGISPACDKEATSCTGQCSKVESGKTTWQTGKGTDEYAHCL